MAAPVDLRIAPATHAEQRRPHKASVRACPRQVSSRQRWRRMGTVRGHAPRDRQRLASLEVRTMSENRGELMCHVPTGEGRPGMHCAKTALRDRLIQKG